MSERTLVEPTMPPGGDPEPWLVVVRSADARAKGFALPRAGERIVGRAADAGVRIEDPGISRHHAKLLLARDGACTVVDLGSTNGTFVNGARVRRRVLNDGDRIQLGKDTVVRYSERGPADDGDSALRTALAAAGLGTWQWTLGAERIAFVDVSGTLAQRGAGAAAELSAHLVRHEAPRVFGALISAAVARRAVEVDARLDAGGQERWVSLRGDVTLDAGGQVTGLSGVVLDVTERKEAERALERQALLFENLGDGVVVFDLAGAVVDMNGSAERMLGRSRASLAGEPVGVALGGAEDLTDQILERVAADGRWEREVAREPGALEVRAVPLRDRSGGNAAYVALLRDVGPIREMESQLRIAERLASLGTLVAGLAHEVNNPLAYVLANLDYLTDVVHGAGEVMGGGLATSLEDVLDETREGAERIRVLVRDFTRFARGGQGDAPRALAVNDVVQLALKLAGPHLRHVASVEVTLGAVGSVLGSESELGQVFLNLLVNAAQAVSQGAKAGRIAVRTFEDAGRVVIEVEDDGCGIAAEHVKRVFDPFFSTKPVGQGTGLGLFVSYQIVAHLGGVIRVDSAPGRGSTFRVELPRAGATLSAAPEPALAPARRGRARILVIDDDPRVAAAIARVLGPAHDVTCARSAAEALQKLRGGERYEVLLCDLAMPERTGADLFETIGSEAPSLAERVIFMTAGAVSTPLRRFAEAHAHRLVEKPIQMERLARLIDERLGRLVEPETQPRLH
jgi:PAS domain S-box-containing protein